MPQIAYGFPARSRSRSLTERAITLTVNRGHHLIKLTWRAALDHPRSFARTASATSRGEYQSRSCRGFCHGERDAAVHYSRFTNRYFQLEILDENDRGGVVDDVLQSLFTGSQSFLGLIED
jgi:hypothetical protein